MQTISSSTSGKFFLSVSLTEHEELWTPQDPCVEEPTYSFQGCIKESLSREAGCRMHWDTVSDQTKPVCTTLAQYEPFAKKYEILEDSSMREITERTGCQKPCRYKEYVLIDGMQRSTATINPAYLSLDVWMVTTDITVKTEQLIISPASLVANIGGTLSLFLGISFNTLGLGLWDVITQLANIGKTSHST
jgi:hypothetical protein